MRLVQLTHSSGARMSAQEAKDDDGSVLYLCARDACPHWRGQPGLPGMGSAAAMHCELVGYAPEHTCQAEYMDRVVSLDQARRTVWQRLDDAIALERRRHHAAWRTVRAVD